MSFLPQRAAKPKPVGLKTVIRMQYFAGKVIHWVAAAGTGSAGCMSRLRVRFPD